MKNYRLLHLVLSGLMVTAISFGQAVTPQTDGSKCYFQVANVYFEVDPTYGGRITSLKLDNKEILYTDPSIGMWGSTFWESPQTWAWPPASALDTDPFHGGIVGNSVSIISNMDNKGNTKLKFRKIFTADLADTSITIDYYMINTGTSAKSFAPWEITRVPVGGMAFFVDSGPTTGVLSPAFNKIGDLQWINYQGASLAGGTNKTFSNSKEGWLAWLNTDSLVFIKQYKNIQTSQAAPGENETEVYYNGPGTYFELEDQGEYKSIAAKDSLKWTVKWYARKVSDTVDTAKGSVGLANFVRRVLANAANAHPDTTHTSLLKSNASDKVSVSPNPANQLIRVSGLTENSNIRITDISGRIIFSAAIKINENSVSLSRIEEGIYLYTIYSANVKHSGKLIIKR